MNPFSAAWNAIIDGLTSALELLHGVLEPVFGTHAWGWSIIALTLLVRVALLPLAIKQTRSMRGMQAIQPKVKKIQAKYKVDRDLLKKDPETYQKRKAEMNEQLMALYKEEGVNPAASCLPLVLQMPIFFALFRILNPGSGGLVALVAANFYFFTDSVTATVGSVAEPGTVTGEAASQILGLGASVKQAGWPGYLLILAMSATMFITQRQMMSRQPVDGPAATQQKIMMYVFPVFLAFISLNFPLAVVLYWVTTNLWQGAQQYIMFRTVADDATDEAIDAANAAKSKAVKPKPDTQPPARPAKQAKPTKPAKPAKDGPSGNRKPGDDGHLPRKKTT